MKICGIVVEYNPFHNGHIHHIEQARQISGCELLVAVMSPYFVQRGEAAIAGKWERAELAVRYGVDLVIELPTLHAVQSAAYFAQAAVSLLAAAQANTLVFGSECGDLARLTQTAEKAKQVYLHPGAQSTVRQYAKQLGNLPPNDVLGINYIRWCADYGIKPLCIPRTNAYHSQCCEGTIASASAIRHALRQHKDVSAYTPMRLQADQAPEWEAFYPYLRNTLLLADPKQMRSFFLMDEGIEALLRQAATAETYSAFLARCTNARYTHARIQRTLLHYLLQTTKAQANAHPLPMHIRPLAFHKKARPLLRRLQDEDAAVVSRFADLPDFYRESEKKAALLYGLCDMQQQKQLLKREWEAPVYVDLDR